MDGQMDLPATGRQLQVGHTDRTSAARTPIAPLRAIPPAARRSFAPYVETIPGPRPGENDLTRIAPGRPRAQGDAIGFGGRIVDEFGRPLRGVLVEIWNANKWGRYTHADDPAREPLDPHFAGFGRTITDEEGNYRFLTIVPAPYLVRPDINRWRPAHIHLSIRGGASRLVTQMYFEGDQYLARDPGFALLGDAGPRHFGKVGPATAPDLTAEITFDVVVGGRNTTAFEDS